MEYYSGLSITIYSIATIALILFAWNVEKRILDDEDIPKKNKIIKSILIIIVLLHGIPPSPLWCSPALCCTCR